MPEMRTLNGYEVVDAKAREDIAGLQEAIENIDFPEMPDLTPYATKSEIPTKVSQLQNDSKFITREEVPEVDLSEYITEQELNAKGYLTEHQSLAGYATEGYVVNKLDSAANELGEYVGEAERRISAMIPTRVSQLVNDKEYLTEIPSEYVTNTKLDLALANSGFLTEHQDLSAYAKKSAIPTKVSQLENDIRYITLADVPKTDLSNYALKAEIPDISKCLTAVPAEYVTESELSAHNYATEQYVTNKVTSAMPDLTTYARKAEVPDVSIYAKKEELPDFSIFPRRWEVLTEVPAEYVTEGELDGKGYATQNYVRAQIAQAQLEGEEVDLSGYATKDELPNMSLYAKKEEIPNMELYAKKTDVLTEVPSEYVTDSELSNRGYATELFVSAKIAEAKLNGTDVDLSAYALKSDIPDVSDFISEIPSEYITENELNDKRYASEDFVVQKVAEAQLSGDSGEVDLSDYATKAYVDEAIENIDIPEVTTDLSNYYTKAEVDEAIEAIDVPEADLTGYATENFVTQKIAEAQLAGTEVDLSAYATKEYVAANYSTTTKMQEDIDRLFLEFEDLVDDDVAQVNKIFEVENTLTERLNNDYYTKTEVDQAITQAQLGGDDVDLSNYYTKAEVNQAIAANSPTSGNGKIKVVLPYFDISELLENSIEVTNSTLKSQIATIASYIIAGNTDVLDRYEIYQQIPNRCNIPVTYVSAMDTSEIYSVPDSYQIFFKCLDLDKAAELVVLQTRFDHGVTYPDTTTYRLRAVTSASSFSNK